MRPLMIIVPKALLFNTLREVKSAAGSVTYLTKRVDRGDDERTAFDFDVRRGEPAPRGPAQFIRHDLMLLHHLRFKLIPMRKTHAKYWELKLCAAGITPFVP